ncbi:YrdC-like domain-containing protein [Bordetella tumbae]|uniref:Sua5/YciO/YrdC/YwlC family protein n=1 Tax=Bordetella tumbae TaxID=1649139 RepID=UPI0039EFD106
MPTLDIAGDARRTIDVIKRGGIALVPNDTGYALCGSSLDPLKKIFVSKQRGTHKRNAMGANLDTQRELHTLDRRAQEMVEALVVDHNLPVAVVGTFRTDHPVMRKLDPDLVRASTASDTLALLLNAGPFHEALCALAYAECVPLLGSSANLTGTGSRYRVEDVPQVLRDLADITIDYGLRRAHIYQRAGTVINFNTLEVIRIGAYYELISDVLKRSFGVELPPDPGIHALPSGHLNEFALKESE